MAKYISPTIQRRSEARTLLQSQGFTAPSPAQISTESKRLLGDQKVQQKRENVANVREQAQQGKTTTVATVPTYDMNRYLSESTPTFFKSQLQSIMQNRLAARNAPIESAGRDIAGSLATIPETTAAVPGFAGLTLSQARRLQDIEQGGLQNVFQGLAGTLERRGTRLRELSEDAAQAFSEQQQLAREKENKLAARRQAAIADIQQEQARIASLGLALDPVAGQQFIKEALASTNPEEVSARYISTASRVPSVQAARRPRSTGGGGIKSDDLESIVNAVLDKDGEINPDLFNELPSKVQLQILQYIGQQTGEAPIVEPMKSSSLKRIPPELEGTTFLQRFLSPAKTFKAGLKQLIGQ